MAATKQEKFGLTRNRQSLWMESKQVDYSIDSISRLPSARMFTDNLKSLAMLDALYMPEWDFRYFSFNSRWSENEAMASMRDGEGSEYFILISDVGIIGKLFSPESRANAKSVLQLVPDTFSSFKTEPAFDLDYISCVFWRSKADPDWSVCPAPPKIPLLRFALGNPAFYKDWAESYYESTVDMTFVEKIFAHTPLCRKLLLEFNFEDIDFAGIGSDLREIGYPFELQDF